MSWIKTKDSLPAIGEVVDTKIHDTRGLRNEQKLKRNGSLWFCPDDSMYVYYRPTHWKRVSQPLADMLSATRKKG